ncbi:hypothetical protein [Streptomyces finlayi]|nr:hypothetical protein [Streptomyces finlayi]
MSGGSLPLPVLGAALLLTAGAGWGLAGRERTAAVVVAASALGQVSLHVCFVSLPSASSGPRSTAGHLTAGHLATGHTPAGHHPGATGRAAHASPESVADGSSGATAFVAAFDGSALTLGMVSAHLVAGLVCGLWMWRGEAAFVQLGRSLALFVCAPLRTAWRLWAAGQPPGPVTPGRARRRPGRRPQDLLLLHGLSLRGPPLRRLSVRPSPAH